MPGLLKNISFSLAIILIFTSCGHVRVKYEAKVKKKEESAVYSFTRSYRVGQSDRLFCALSFVLAGGWCWSYLFYPSQDIREDINYEAEDMIQQKIGPDFIVLHRTIERESFKYAEDEAYFIYDGNKVDNPPL